ncbi:MAG: antibiotic biosynthesis monooxygenase [Myxococcota bacterium]|nr:antibiotic biosynthesis monooxygenase [Myxococcota bacterium]
MGGTPNAFEGPATLIFRRKVKPGRAPAYREWVEGMQRASKDVIGFLGASTMRGDVEEDYISIVRFDTFENLRAWEESGLRREWIARLPPDTVDGDADVRRLEGLEFWFTAPPGVAAPVAPSPHKMALILVVIVLALVSALTPVVRAVVGVDAPPFARSAVMVVLQVFLMTYVIMPRVTKLLAGWLFRK